MTLSPFIRQQLTHEQLNARDSQFLAHIISFGPAIFQTARLMIKYHIFELLNSSSEGLTEYDITRKTGLSQYATKCLLEASLTIGAIYINDETNCYFLSKTGLFLLNDPLIRVNMDFNHNINYMGWFLLDKALEEGRPAGLKHFGNWETIYEGLSSLPEPAKSSWFTFDHYYSDNSFDYALSIIFKNRVKHILDIGGNTGRFAMRCVDYNKEVNVTICDLPQQISLMHAAIANHQGAKRIEGIRINLLDTKAAFPVDTHYDIIWMSQFLDCFSEENIVSILSRAAKIMDDENRLYIMETLWDRQKYLPAAFALTHISLYFTAQANGNSKMYNTDDMLRLINLAGLEVENIHDNIGMAGHSILVCKK